MKVSTKGRYALRFMIDLAQQEQGIPVRLKNIADRQGFSEKYMEQIIIGMNKAKLVKSIRGLHGGYMLVKKPEEYTVKEVLAATENTLAPVSCLATKSNSCSRRKKCSTLKFWEGLQKVVDDYLSATTIADLAKKL